MTEAQGADREFLLSRLRCAALQMRLYENELVSVGVALRGGAITAQQAAAWLTDLGAWPLLDPGAAS